MVDWLHNISFHLTKFIVSRLNREVLLRKWSHFKAKLSLNHVYNYKQYSISNGGNNIYLIGFAMVRVVKAWDVEIEHSNSVGTTHTMY